MDETAKTRGLTQSCGIYVLHGLTLLVKHAMSYLAASPSNPLLTAVIIHVHRIFHNKNHPAIGVPPFSGLETFTVSMQQAMASYIIHEEATRLHVKLAQGPVGGHRGHTNRKEQHQGHVPINGKWSNYPLVI